VNFGQRPFAFNFEVESLQFERIKNVPSSVRQQQCGCELALTMMSVFDESAAVLSTGGLEPFPVYAR
jgi:hypothetical protein